MVNLSLRGSRKQVEQNGESYEASSGQSLDTVSDFLTIRSLTKQELLIQGECVFIPGGIPAEAGWSFK